MTIINQPLKNSRETPSMERQTERRRNALSFQGSQSILHDRNSESKSEDRRERGWPRGETMNNRRTSFSSLSWSSFSTTISRPLTRIELAMHCSCWAQPHCESKTWSCVSLLLCYVKKCWNLLLFVFGFYSRWRWW